MTSAYSSPAFKAQISATPNRPILTSLNGDTSWLMSFPVPVGTRTADSKAFYHVVSDVWLQGDTGLGWGLIYIKMTWTPTIRDGAAVDAIVREIEAAAGSNVRGASVDAILANFHYDDHLHEATLRTFDAQIPLFATPESAGIARKWKHFSTIVTTKDFSGSSTDEGWGSYHPGAPLPPWLTFFRLPGHSVLNFATAIIWSPSADQHEMLLYSPHGIRATQPSAQALLKLAAAPNANLSVLAILYVLKTSYAFGIQTVLGVEGGLALERAAKPRYWINTANAVLSYSGLVMFLGRVKDYFFTLDAGLEAEKEKMRDTSVEVQKRPNFVDVPMGEAVILV